MLLFTMFYIYSKGKQKKSLKIFSVSAKYSLSDPAEHLIIYLT